MDKQTCNDFLKIIEKCSTHDNTTCSKIIDDYVRECVENENASHFKTLYDISSKASLSKS
jgi:hypothetical protein